MKTKLDYENYLNRYHSPKDPNDAAWTIGGKHRRQLAWKGVIGTAIRRHDPIRFNVGFIEYRRKHWNT